MRLVLIIVLSRWISGSKFSWIFFLVFFFIIDSTRSSVLAVLVFFWLLCLFTSPRHEPVLLYINALHSHPIPKLMCCDCVNGADMWGQEQDALPHR